MSIPIAGSIKTKARSPKIGRGFPGAWNMAWRLVLTPDHVQKWPRLRERHPRSVRTSKKSIGSGVSEEQREPRDSSVRPCLQTPLLAAEAKFKHEPWAQQWRTSQQRARVS